MSSSDGSRHGSQMDSDRYRRGTADERIRDHYRKLWDPMNVIGVETDTVNDTYRESRELHELIDYAGIDYIVDTHAEIFGVNHREHSPGRNRRFDLRSETGSCAPSELEKMKQAFESNTIVPRYASRLKRDKQGRIEWVRVVKLRPLIKAIKHGLSPAKTWSGKETEAQLYEYDLLDKMGLIEYEKEDTYV